MPILLIADHDNHSLRDETLRAISAARQLDDEIHVLVAGHAARSVAEAAACVDGVAKVLLAEHPALAERLPEPLADYVAMLAQGYAAVVAPASNAGKNMLPRVAALHDVMQVSDVIAIDAPDTFRRPIYAGSAIQTVRVPQTPRLLTIRTAFFAPAATGAQAAAPIELMPVVVKNSVSRLVERRGHHDDRPDLGAARIVVAGGRALGSRETFETLIIGLADQLGAAVGASRAAVDAGYAPNEWQVGQTGRVVAPELYLAIGISGAIQHLAGMKDAKVIAAINSDPNAPIFQHADYGLVADLFTALPEFSAALAAREGKV